MNNEELRDIVDIILRFKAGYPDLDEKVVYDYIFLKYDERFELLKESASKFNYCPICGTGNGGYYKRGDL